MLLATATVHRQDPINLKHPHMKNLLCLLGLLLLAPTLNAQAWSRVPPIPADCYHRAEGAPNDVYRNAVDVVDKDLDDKLAAQNERNEQLKAQVTEEQKRKAEMQYGIKKMSQNPEKYMQEMEDRANTDRQLSEEHDKLEARFTALEAEFKAEKMARFGPIEAEMAKIPDGEGMKPADYQRFKGLLATWNEKYVKLCGEYLTGGAFPAWLANYKSHLNRRIAQQQIEDRETKEQYGFSSYDSLPEYTAARDYMRYLLLIAAKREKLPRS
jgi:hypothetical protein